MMVLVMLRNSGNKIDDVNGVLLFQLYFSMFRFDCLLLLYIFSFCSFETGFDTSNDLNPCPIRFNYPGNRSTLIVKIKDVDYLNAWEKILRMIAFVSSMWAIAAGLFSFRSVGRWVAW